MSHDIMDFQKDVIERSSELPVLVDFWAEWCAPCKALGPVLEKLESEADGQWELQKLNTEQFPAIAAQYAIRSIPAVKLFIDGKVVNEFVGAMPESDIVKWLGTALPDPFGPAVTRAIELFNTMQYSKVELELAPVLAQRPDHIPARLILASSVLFIDRPRAMQIIEPLLEEYSVRERVEAIQTLNETLSRAERAQELPEAAVKETYVQAIEHLTKHDFDKALECFIDALRKDRYYDDDRSRKACIAIFKFLGEEHEITLRHRREFNRAF